jgi:hypothetical protein
MQAISYFSKEVLRIQYTAYSSFTIHKNMSYRRTENQKKLDCQKAVIALAHAMAMKGTQQVIL